MEHKELRILGVRIWINFHHVINKSPHHRTCLWTIEKGRFCHRFENLRFSTEKIFFSSPPYSIFIFSRPLSVLWDLFNKNRPTIEMKVAVIGVWLQTSGKHLSVNIGWTFVCKHRVNIFWWVNAAMIMFWASRCRRCRMVAPKKCWICITAMPQPPCFFTKVGQQPTQVGNFRKIGWTKSWTKFWQDF